MIRRMSEEKMYRLAPSIFADAPHSKTSPKYSFLPTKDIIRGLGDLNWHPVKVQEQKVRDTNRIGFQKHLVELENPDIQLFDGLRPRFIVTNSFDWSAPFSFMLGIFRLVCSNGLVIADAMFENFKTIHRTYTLSEIEDSVYGYVQRVPELMNHLHEYKTTKMEYEQVMDFTQKAIDIRFPNDRNIITIEDAIATRRPEDDENNLWNLFNVVQENLINHPEAKSMKSNRKIRPVKAIDERLKMNQALWALMNNYIRR